MESIILQAGLTSKVKLLNVAIGDIFSQCGITMPDGLHTGNARISTENTNKKSYNIKMMPLANIISSDNSMVKLDIEGSEYKALSGSRKILEFRKPIIIFENWKNEENSIDLLKMLKNCNFSYFMPTFYLCDKKKLLNYGDYKSYSLEDFLSKKIRLALVQFDYQTRDLLPMLINVVAIHNSLIPKILNDFSLLDI